jgi:hypothetical protein
MLQILQVQKSFINVRAVNKEALVYERLNPEFGHQN